MGRAVVLIEVLDAKCVPARLAIKAQASQTRAGGAGNRLASRRSLPGCYCDHGITLKLNRFRLKSSGMMAHTAFRIFNARLAEEPVRDRIPPHIGLTGLVVELLQDLLKSLLIHASPERLPLLHEPSRSQCSFVVRVVEGLNHRLA